MSGLVTDKRRGEAPWFVITGDTLFVGAVGRPDLAGREREMAAQLYETLHMKLLSLPDTLEIYPAHRAGIAWGAGLSGKPMSTLGSEKQWHPQPSPDGEQFIASVSDVLPTPAEMETILRVNRGLRE